MRDERKSEFESDWRDKESVKSESVYKERKWGYQKLKPIELPTFAGDKKEYPKFHSSISYMCAQCTI